MRKVKILIDIKEITDEGEFNYCVPVYVKKLGFLDCNSKEAEHLYYNYRFLK